MPPAIDIHELAITLETGPVQIVPQPVTYRSSPEPRQQLWVCDVPVTVPAGEYQRIPGTTDDAGWRPTLIQGKADVHVSGIPSAGTDPGTRLRKGSVTLPSRRSPGQYRILVTESQLLLSDALRHSPDRKETIPCCDRPLIPDRPSSITAITIGRARGRLVFAEAIPV